MATYREGAAQPIPDEGQHLYRVVVERNNMTLGPRVRQSGEAFHATELSPEVFRLVRDGLIAGARLEELSSGRLPPLQIPDVVTGFREDGSPIMIPGDRRANQGYVFSVHGNVTPQKNRVELYKAQTTTVEQETAQRLAEEQGLDVGDLGEEQGLDVRDVHRQLASLGAESLRSAEEQEEGDQILAEAEGSGEGSSEGSAASGQGSAAGRSKGSKSSKAAAGEGSGSGEE